MMDEFHPVLAVVQDGSAPGVRVVAVLVGAEHGQVLVRRSFQEPFAMSVAVSPSTFGR